MIKGNAMDVYTVVFANEEEISLMAYDRTMARFMAKELVPHSAILAMYKKYQWEENND